MRVSKTKSPPQPFVPDPEKQAKTAKGIVHRLGLTPRQYAVLEQAWKGNADKVIASELRMSRSTVRAHLAAIFLRLGVNTRCQAAVAFQVHLFLRAGGST